MAFKYKVQPGDSLNAIANRYGFANYKMAGISSVPSGNFDLIRPGEEISLGNYDPTKVQPIGSTPPVLSSNDAAGENKALGSSLDTKLGVGVEPVAPPIDPNAPKPPTSDTGASTTKSSGDLAYDEMLRSQETGKASAEKWGAEKSAEIAALLPRTLALIDSQYASSVTNIQGTYGKLIEEQKRINAVNVDRTKSYGLGAGGQYMPLEYTSAVSDQEQKAANAIANLENERTDLLGRAKLARDQGEITSLRENMDALNKIEETMRQRTKDLADEVQKRYELTVKVRKEQEAKHQESVTKMLDAVKIKYWKDFQGAKTEEDKVKIIRKIVLESGGTLTDKDFYSIYSSLSGAVSTAKEEELKTRKTEADIKSTEALTAERNASAAKNWADAATKKTEKKGIEDMKSEIDAMTFVEKGVDKGFEDGEKKRQAFVKKYGADGKKYWDDVFLGEENKTYNYDFGGGGGKTSVEATDFRAKYKY